jgi:HEAT repeat protein
MSKNEKRGEVKRDEPSEVRYGVEVDVPGLLAALQDSSPEKRSYGARALGTSRSHRKEVLRALRASLNDPDVTVRLYAAGSLCRLTAKSAAAVPTFAQGLRGDTPALRAEAAMIVGELADQAVRSRPRLLSTLRLIIPVLIDNLQDQSPAVRYAACWALARFGPAAAEAVPALVRSLGDGDEDVRTEAARALGLIGPSARPAVPVLLKVLAKGHGTLCALAAGVLGLIGADDPAVARALGEALHHPEQAVRVQAAESLARLGGGAACAADAIITALPSSADDVFYWLTEAVVHLGTRAREAVPTLEGLSDHPSLWRRQRAREVIAAVQQINQEE